MNITRRSHSRGSRKISITKYNNIIEELGKSIISNTSSKNIELLKSIQSTKTSYKNIYIEEIIQEYPKITPEIISRNITFIALIYQNKSIYSIIKNMLNIKEETHEKYILYMIGPFFPESDIVGGTDIVVQENNNNNNTNTNNNKKSIFIPWFFLISLLSMLWVSYISYNQLFFIQHELEKNTAFSLVKDVGSAAMTCDFKNIHLSKEEESIFKIIKYANSKYTIIDNFILENIEKTIKLRKCILDPKGTFETDVFNQNIRTGTEVSNNYKKQILNIETNIVPSQLESKKVISQSLALVPSSTAAMLVPTETMQKYIMNYNTELYNNIEKKIRTDVETIRDPTALINYFKKMENMDLRDFKSFFEEKTYLDSDSSIPSMKDLKNILGIFGGETDTVFSLFIKSFAGMNIIDVVYSDYKKRMIMIHTELTIKSAQLNNYIENLIIDSSILITLLISFKTILCWFVFVSINFGLASYKMVGYIREQMKRSKSKSKQLSLKKSNHSTNFITLQNKTK
jgi:hypothetical protein